MNLKVISLLLQFLDHLNLRLELQVGLPLKVNLSCVEELFSLGDRLQFGEGLLHREKPEHLLTFSFLTYQGLSLNVYLLQG